MNYYIQGSKEREAEIKAAFKQLGCEYNGIWCSDNLFYFTLDGKVYATAQESCKAIIKTHPDYKELELPIEPCFKVGDKIEATIYGIKRRVTIRAVDKTNRCYFGTLAECIGFSEQDQWHLAPKPHYDIANFQPFDKVLVRDNDRGKWRPSIFSYHIKGKQTCYPFCCIGNSFSQCIPYEGNEHLLGTTDMPSEEYVNW